MYAAVIEKPYQLVVKEVPTPAAGPRQVVLKTLAASVCNATDNHLYSGIFCGRRDYYPQILGHEVCGRVVEVGEGVTEVKIGDRIGMCTPKGAFAEYVQVDLDKNIYAKVPDNLSDEEGSICEMFHGAYVQAVACADLKPGEKVLIVGTGPMGLTALGAAVAHGAEVTAIDFYQNRLDMALEFGAKHVYNRSKMSSKEITEKILAEVGQMDVAFMCIALDRSEELDAFYTPVEVLRPNGRMAGLNVDVKLEHHNHRMNPYHMNSKNIKYRHFLEHPCDNSYFQKGFDLVGAGKIKIGRLITHRVTLDELPWALDMCHNHLDECIKIIIYPKTKLSEENSKE